MEIYVRKQKQHLFAKRLEEEQLAGHQQFKAKKL